MWRATLDASAVTEPGKAILTIVDIVPTKSTTGNTTITVQPPGQIYIITVWPSAEAMQAAHFSLARRLTGLSASLWAGLSVACAIGIGVWHIFLSYAAQRALAQEGLFIIHGIQKTDAGYQAIFFLDTKMDLQLQHPMSLLDSVVKYKIICYSLFNDNLEGLCKHIEDMTFLTKSGRF
jgi:hypothetical protein